MDLEKWESLSGCMDSSWEEAVWQALARWVEEGEAGKVVTVELQRMSRSEELCCRQRVNG